MKSKKLLLLALLAPLFALPALADDPVEVGGIYYNLVPENRVATVTKWGRQWGNYSGPIDIPNTITVGGRPYSVQGIEEEAFGGSLITSVIIHNSVTTIGQSAFSGCSILTSIIIPGSVTYIGQTAFSDCGLTSVTIPNSLTNIPIGCFFGCDSLTSVIIPNSVTTIGQYAFAFCGLTSVIIPESITCIEQRVFDGCGNLISIAVDEDNTVYDSRNGCNGIIEIATRTLVVGYSTTIIPESVIGIGSYAFEGCNNIASITIPDSVTDIGDYAFFRTHLTSVTISNSVTRIGKGTFLSCSSLTSVVSLIQKPFSFGEEAFKGISDDCVLTVPFGTKEVYIAAGWTEEVFKGGIVEAEPVPATVSITLGNAGVATFCSEEALDFSGTDEVKAYIVSAFRPSTGNVTLTRITDVPAGTGIILLGNAGTYEIPVGTGETVVSNLLTGVTSAETLNKVEGENTNFILADGENGVGFYTVVDGSTLAAGKAYLSLPTAALPSNAQSIGLRFDGTTGIRSMENGQWRMAGAEWYTIDGRHLDAEPTAKGIYTVNGKKVFVK